MVEQKLTTEGLPKKVGLPDPSYQQACWCSASLKKFPSKYAIQQRANSEEEVGVHLWRVRETGARFAGD